MLNTGLTEERSRSFDVVSAALMEDIDVYGRMSIMVSEPSKFSPVRLAMLLFTRWP